MKHDRGFLIIDLETAIEDTEKTIAGFKIDLSVNTFNAFCNQNVYSAVAHNRTAKSILKAIKEQTTEENFEESFPVYMNSLYAELRKKAYSDNYNNPAYGMMRRYEAEALACFLSELEEFRLK